MFDERFARQYRYELPPEFPLASPYAGIVHHLSGPRGRAHTQTFCQRLLVGRCCCLRLASLTFITRVGFSTSTLARTLDSLVRVSRRVGKDHFDRIAQSTLRRSSYRDPWSDNRSLLLHKHSAATPPHPASQKVNTARFPLVLPVRL